MDGVIPEWLGAAAIGAIVAAVGYVAKLIIQWLTEMRANTRARRSRLVSLHSLLQTGKDAFMIQCDNRNRLYELIYKRDPNLDSSILGYERVFTAAYPTMTPDEKELHTIIRAYTMNAIRPLNEQILKWLQEDTYFKAQNRGNRIGVEVAKKLAQLDSHLRLWHAKYDVWIPDNPAHSLVYLADEEHHGIEFPSRLEDDIQKLLET